MKSWRLGMTISFSFQFHITTLPKTWQVNQWSGCASWKSMWWTPGHTSVCAVDCHLRIGQETDITKSSQNWDKSLNTYIHLLIFVNDKMLFFFQKITRRLYMRVLTHILLNIIFLLRIMILRHFSSKPLSIRRGKSLHNG